MSRHDLTSAQMTATIAAAAREAALLFAARGWVWAGVGVPDEARLRETLTALVWSARRHAMREKHGYAFAASGRLWVTVRREGKAECLHLGIDLAEVSAGE